MNFQFLISNFQLSARGRNGRVGQSLVELLVAVAVGTIMMLGAITVIVPALKSQTDVGKLQASVIAAKGLMDQARVWSEKDWHNLYNLQKGSSNTYFLVASSSATTFVATGTESLLVNDILDSGLLALWKFDESTGTTTYDSSGYGNNGTLQVGTSTLTRVSGNIGNAWGCDGADDYVSVNLSMPASTGTVTMWVKDPAPGAGNYLLRTNTNNRTYIRVVAGPQIRFDKGNPSVQIGSSDNLAAGVWHFAALAWRDDAGTLKASSYVDGAPIATDITFTDSTAGTFATICGINQTGTQNASGTISEVRIYNRTLSASEIKNLYNSSVLSRSFYVENVNRDGSGYITTGAGTDDPSTQKVTVSYRVGSNPAATLSAYLTRFRNRTFLQDDWIGGTGFDGPYTTSTNKFSTSTSIDNASSSGSIIISGF